MPKRGRRLGSLRRGEILRALHRAGFVSLRKKGSHEFLHHPDCRRLTVAIHPTVEAGPPIVRKILRDAGLGEGEFLRLL